MNVHEKTQEDLNRVCEDVFQEASITLMERLESGGFSSDIATSSLQILALNLLEASFKMHTAGLIKNTKLQNLEQDALKGSLNEIFKNHKTPLRIVVTH